MKTLHINYPGDGKRIMERCEGVFHEDTDHCVSVHLHDGEKHTLGGGVVYNGFLGGSIQLHMAGSGISWANRDFLWLVFDYVFCQLGCCKAFGLVGAHNIHALNVDLRLGFRIEAVLRRALWGGEDLLVLSMFKEECKWLNWQPKLVKANWRATGEVSDGLEIKRAV